MLKNVQANRYKKGQICHFLASKRPNLATVDSLMFWARSNILELTEKTSQGLQPALSSSGPEDGGDHQHLQVRQHRGGGRQGELPVQGLGRR